MTYKKRTFGRKFCLLLLTMLFTISLLVYAGTRLVYAVPKPDPSPQNRLIKQVIVNQGDTLWSLIKENYAYSGDIRKAIYEVQQINNLKTAAISPGEILFIPIE